MEHAGMEAAMISLTEQNPKWLGLLRPNSGEGLELDCPKCGPVHRLAVYFSNPLDGKLPAPWQQAAWKREGEDFDSLTVEPSLQYQCFHGWIEDGQVIDISEATMHGLMLVDGVQKVIALSPRQSKKQESRT